MSKHSATENERLISISILRPACPIPDLISLFCWGIFLQHLTSDIRPDQTGWGRKSGLKSGFLGNNVVSVMIMIIIITVNKMGKRFGGADPAKQ